MGTEKPASLPREGKKRYLKPELRVYGDLRKITQALVGPVGNVDAAGDPFKTQTMG